MAHAQDTQLLSSAREMDDTSDDDLPMHPYPSTPPLLPEHIVRAASPPGRRYLKPVNGIQIKGFARSAQRRSSVVTLGSIERLQHFYAKKELIVNKSGTLGFKKTGASEVIKEEELQVEDDEDDDDLAALPTPTEPTPTWKEFDVETDLDVLLSTCFEDIQLALTTWAMVTGPRASVSDASATSESSSSSTPLRRASPLPMLPLLQSVTKMIQSVKTYSMHRHDLPDAALSRLRQSALALLAAMTDLELRHRHGATSDNDEGDTSGFLYQPSPYHHLDGERDAILAYLATVEECVLNPPHRRIGRAHAYGAKRTSFTQEIRDLIISTSGSETSSIVSDDDGDDDNRNHHKPPAMPAWLIPGAFDTNPLGQCHAFLSDHTSEAIPDPHEDETLFWAALA
ncbi:hypothetical protein BC940DRAFT_63488 [Gongronella butleri]|nr:hypothetical protein BC940DRAFT_63488 [Gongronella butleri]